MRKIISFREMLNSIHYYFGKTSNASSPQLYVPIQKYLKSYPGSQYSSKIADKAS
jgi:hypothetical protein